MRRRADDAPMKEIHSRLDKQDDVQRNVEKTLASSDNKLALLAQEMKHYAELQASRSMINDQNTMLLAQKLEVLSKDIAGMGAEAQATPAGRSILKDMEQTNDSLTLLKETVTTLVEWQTSVKSIISMAKWIGASNIAMMAWLLLKAFKVVP